MTRSPTPSAGEVAPSSVPSPAESCASAPESSKQSPEPPESSPAPAPGAPALSALPKRPRAWLSRFRGLSRRRRLTVYAVLLIVAVAVGGSLDLAVLMTHPQRVEVTMPQRKGGSTGPSQETWLVLGLDSRETVPGGPDRYGSAQEVPGSRADVIALVQPSEKGLTVLTLPRDLVLLGHGGTMERLATSYLSGPQRTVDLLCESLGVTTTHLVAMDMAQFASIIDTLGGMPVDIPEPVRDTYYLLCG